MRQLGLLEQGFLLLLNGLDFMLQLGGGFETL